MTDNRTTELRVKRLRELLDERGIEHYDHENGEPLRVLEEAEEPATSWRVDGASYCAVPDNKGTFDIWIDHCTPEQAIAATLGRGKCRIEHRGMGYYCSECGEEVGSDDPESELYIYANAIELWSHCPRCGAEVGA